MILCRRGKAEEALQQLRQIMGKLKLTVNEEKTRICKVPEGKFDFLGYTFGRMYSARTGKAYLGYRPSRKSIKRMIENVHALTVRAGTWQETTGLVKKLNRTLRGWATSSRHRHKSVPGARQLHRCAVAPVVALQAQGQATQGRGLSTLAPLRVLRARAPVPAWARRAVGEVAELVREPDAGNLHVRFDERDVETESWSNHVRHRQTKEAETDMFDLQPPRHISTLHKREMLMRAANVG